MAFKLNTHYNISWGKIKLSYTRNNHNNIIPFDTKIIVFINSKSIKNWNFILNKKNFQFDSYLICYFIPIRWAVDHINVFKEKYNNETRNKKTNTLIFVRSEFKIECIYIHCTYKHTKNVKKHWQTCFLENVYFCDTFRIWIE